MRFTVYTEATDELNLRETFERFANDLWIPDHLTERQAARFALDLFRRSLLDELDSLRVRVSDEPVIVG